MLPPILATVGEGADNTVRHFVYFAATLHRTGLERTLRAFSVPRLNYLPFQYPKRRSMQRSD